MPRYQSGWKWNSHFLFLEVELALLVQLHVQLRIAGIHARLDAVLHLLVVAVGLRVLVRVFAHAAEGEERTEAESGGRMGINQCVADEDTVFMVNENLLLAQNDATHTIHGGRDVLAIKLADVLVTVGAEVAIAIVVQTQVEFGAMLYHRFVQRGQQHVVLVVQVRDGNHQQAMILAGVAIHN